MKDLGSGEEGVNSKVKIRQTRQGLMCVNNKRSTQLAQSQSIPGRPLLAPLYRWSSLEDRSGSIQITIAVYNIISYSTRSMLGPI
jgi:hypothetical protein